MDKCYYQSMQKLEDVFEAVPKLGLTDQQQAQVYYLLEQIAIGVNEVTSNALTSTLIDIYTGFEEFTGLIMKISEFGVKANSLDPTGNYRSLLTQ